MTSPPAPFSAAEAFGDLTSAAVERGKLWRLVSSDGTWHCAACGAETAFHVSLHCEWCLTQHHEKRRARAAARARQTPDDLHWEGLAQALITLDRDTGLRMLTKARELKSCTTPRINALMLVFDRRWDGPAPEATWSTYVEPEVPDDLYR